MTLRLGASARNGIWKRWILTIAVVVWGCCLSGCSVTNSSSQTLSESSGVSSAIATASDRQPPSAEPFGAATPLPADVATRVKTALAAQTGMSADQMTLSKVTPQTWSNACLGAAAADEFCAEVITPGYQVTISTPQGKYQLHTDQSGRQIRVGLAE